MYHALMLGPALRARLNGRDASCCAVVITMVTSLSRGFNQYVAKGAAPGVGLAMLAKLTRSRLPRRPGLRAGLGLVHALLVGLAPETGRGKAMRSARQALIQRGA